MPTATRQGPEPALVSAARDGDPQALDALLAASLPLVYNIIGRALHGHADVDDVVQDTMLRVVRGIGDLADPAAYRSWLVAIALRQTRDHGRRKSASAARTAGREASREYADLGSDFAGLTVLRLGLTDQRRDVAEATRWLDPEDRELLSLWWLEESDRLDRRELAEALGLSAPHAAVRVHRMKQQLDTAREVVRALRDAGGCRELGAVAEGWDGAPNPLWRKRFARHIRGCSICGPQDRALIPVARLLRGLPLVPVPLGLAAPQSRQLVQRNHGSHASHRSAGRLHAVGAHPILAATSAAAVAAAVAAGYFLFPRAPQAPSIPLAAVTQAAAGGSSPSVVAVPSSASPSPSPSRSASASRTPSSAAPATKAAKAAAVTTAAQTSSRKGVGSWNFTGADQALAESGASWYYTWSTTTQGVSASGVGFVPLIWGSASVTATALAQAKQSTTCGCVLGFNEPDMSGQANMSVSQALSLWPQLQATGLELGAPAVAGGGATAGGWLDQFMTGARQDKYRVDFIPLHWYGSDFDTADAVSQLQSYIEAVHTRYQLPIWLTEFALIGFSGGSEQFPDEATQAAFLTAATKMLDGLPYVQRYAWFGLQATSTPSSGLFLSGPSTTPVGTAFEAAQ
ncbi:MAG TPA: sigma-70 family RNA polymerase sigma factor [Actinospica sp.]|nr:sigma-70 family RNA polymerase sigma factor [Actinospica sp.]